MDENIINPFVQLVHPEKKDIFRNSFYEEEMEALFKTVEGEHFKSLRDQVILELLVCYRHPCLELVNIKTRYRFLRE